MEPSDLHVALAVEATFSRTTHDPYSRHTEYRGKILVTTEQDQSRPAGEIEFTMFRGLLITPDSRDDWSQADVFDAHSGEALEAYEFILKNIEEVADAYIDTVIIVHKIDLIQEFRGVGVRMEAIRILYEEYQSMNSAVMAMRVPQPSESDPEREDVLALKLGLTSLGLPDMGDGWHMLGFSYQPPGSLNTYRHDVGTD